MIKKIDKIVLSNEKETIEVAKETFDIEKYINFTIKEYKYLLEIDGNEISFLDKEAREDFF